MNLQKSVMIICKLNKFRIESRNGELDWCCRARRSRKYKCKIIKKFKKNYTISPSQLKLKRYLLNLLHLINIIYNFNWYIIRFH